MKRPLVLLSAALLAAGCQSAQRPTDPFLPRTTVPPPQTGSYPTQGAAPYYQGPAPAYQGPAPAYPGPPSSPGFTPNTSAPGNLYNPPGGFAPPQPAINTRSAVPNPGRATQASTTSGWAARAAGSSPRTQPAAVPVDGEPLGQANPVRPAGYSAPTSVQRNGATQAQYAPRVRIRVPQASTVASAPQDGLRRLISDDKAIDIMDLPPARNQ
ncbi:MAG TPA: hypothetical protein VND64_01465 [Pirellulales bacterium]|nr:hypothetical protein [Pirellulales bacterium]